MQKQGTNRFAGVDFGDDSDDLSLDEEKDTPGSDGQNSESESDDQLQRRPGRTAGRSREMLGAEPEAAAQAVIWLELDPQPGAIDAALASPALHAMGSSSVAAAAQCDGGGRSAAY